MNDFNIVTPDWIRQKLKETGKMQKELALEIATDPSRLSEWLNGKRGMTGPVRAAIWYYFKINHENTNTRTNQSAPAGSRHDAKTIS